MVIARRVWKSKDFGKKSEDGKEDRKLVLKEIMMYLL